MASSPTSRSLEMARALGWTAGVVEKWNQHARKRFDLFGFIDIVALDDKPGCLGIQATSGDNVSHRVTKILSEPRAKLWLERGNRIVVIGWRRVVTRKKDGTKSKVKPWRPRAVDVTLEDFVEKDQPSGGEERTDDPLHRVG